MTASSLLVEPAYFTAPDFYRTHGPEVGELAAEAGFAPDPEQQMLLDAQFGVDRYGRATAFEVGVVCARQNIKTGYFKIAALGKVFYLERPLFVWSAHEFSTTQESFRDLMILIESCPTLDRQVKHIHRGSGNEAIELLGGQRIKFKARTKAGGRGLTGDDVCLDEAFALKPEHMGALMPTLSTRRDAQIMYGSSAGLADSEVLRGIRDRGRLGGRRLVYIEWCAPDGGCADGDRCDHALTRKGCALDSEANWRAANPQMGRRIPVQYIASERQALPPAEFARERLGWWDTADLSNDPPVFDARSWKDTNDPKSSAEEVVAFGVAVALDRTTSAIGAAGLRADGNAHLEVVAHDRGVGWVLDACIALAAESVGAVFCIDGSGSAKPLIQQLEDAGLQVVVLSTSDVGAAWAFLVDSVNEKKAFHGPQPELEAAVAGAKRRNIGDGLFAAGRRVSTADIGPIEAVALAAHVLPSVMPLDHVTAAYL